MRRALILAPLAMLALAAWGGLLLFLNRVSPNPSTRVLFLIILFVAVSGTTAPLAYVIGARSAGPLQRGVARRALRQGMLAGALGALLMALQLMRILSPIVALALGTVAVVLEMVFQVRERSPLHTPEAQEKPSARSAKQCVSANRLPVGSACHLIAVTGPALLETPGDASPVQVGG